MAAAKSSTYCFWTNASRFTAFNNSSSTSTQAITTDRSSSLLIILIIVGKLRLIQLWAIKHEKACFGKTLKRNVFVGKKKWVLNVFLFFAHRSVHQFMAESSFHRHKKDYSEYYSHHKICLYFILYYIWEYWTCLACKSRGIYPVDYFQQGARTSRFGAKPPAPQYYKVATTSQ